MQNSIILLTAVESQLPEQKLKPTARQGAQIFFRDQMGPAGYSYIREVQHANNEMPVTAFDSPEGKQLVEKYLQETRDNRRRKIEEIQKRIEDEDIDDIVGDRDFEYLCRHLHGRTNSRSNTLFDGTSWAKGEMIATEEMLSEVINHAEKNDMKLFAVEMTCKF